MYAQFNLNTFKVMYLSGNIYVGNITLYKDTHKYKPTYVRAHTRTYIYIYMQFLVFIALNYK